VNRLNVSTATVTSSYRLYDACSLTQNR